MKKIIVFIVLFLVSFSTFGQKKRIIYKYKKYEKFDFNSLDINSDGSGPGDLSVVPRKRKIFINKLPSKPDFYKETLRSLKDIN